MRWRWCLLSCWRQYRLLGHLCTGEVVIEMMDEQDDREVGMLLSKECILATEIIQGSESIAFVLCASGNV